MTSCTRSRASSSAGSRATRSGRRPITRRAAPARRATLITERYRWSADLLHALPLPAWQRLARTTLAGSRPSEYPATVTGAWITFAVWSPASVAVAAVAVHRRDH
ncbi:hypothetical protein [Kitasatospora sp. NPDC001547]|uniref:hypothetical protein n=1 Tax=Kitasatospora sp. NPDC001547 TaxID=3364015 RepID=UPI0036879A41